MDIDVAAWLQSLTPKPTMVSATQALPGRDEPILSPIPIHRVLDLPLDEVPTGASVAYFASGCYWGAERLFWQQPGVVNTAVGFMGGFTPNPTYQESCTGKTGHTETVQVVFDPTKTSYQELLRVFWESHNPTEGFRQGNDIGTQYRSAIFTIDTAQHDAATRSRDAYQKSLTAAGFGTISTEITPADQFYYAEEYHQQYLAKNPDGYACANRTGVACPPAL